MAGRFTVEAMFKAFDGVSGVVSRMQRRLDGFGKATARVSKGLGDVDRVNGRIMAGAAAFGAATAAGAVLAGAALKDVVETGATFEKTLIGAAAKFSPAIRQGTAEFERLRVAAEEVGAKTEFNAQQGASALKDLASAGFTADQAISALPGVVDLATAAEIELADASNVASKSLGAFNLKTDDAAQLALNLARVNDNLARTADATSASISGLFESIQEGAPVAASTGASIETFMALAGQLSEAGIEGSTAGTTLKNVFLALAAPAKEGADALAQLGIKTGDAKGNMRDVVDILGDIEKKTAKLGTKEKAAMLEQIFGKIPLAGVSSLLGAGTDKIRVLRTELEKAGGSTARMAGIMRDATKGDIDGLTSAIDGVKISIFGLISGPLRGVLKGTTDWVNANRELIATDVATFLKEAAPVVREFFVGMADGARQVKKLAAGVASVVGPVDELFGSSASQRIRNAHELGEFVVKAGAAFVGFALATKAASLITLVFQGVTMGAKAAIWLYEAAIGGAKIALVAYRTWAELGAAGTYRLFTAAIWVTGQLWAQRAASVAASLGLRGIGAASLGATFGLKGVGAAVTGALGPIGLLLAAVALLKDALEELDRVAGGFGAVWAGVKSALKADEVDAMGNAVSSGGFFKGMDEFRNQQARATAARGDQAAALGGGPAATFDSAFMTGDIAKQMAEFEEQLKKVNALSLGDDMPVQRPGDGSRPDPQVAGPAERGAARVERTVTEMRDKLEITVKAGENTEAEVTKKPKRAGVKVEASGAD